MNDYRMLIYAIVLILVMLVTNNPTLKNIWNFIKTKIVQWLFFWRRFRKHANQAMEGGGTDE